MFGVFLFTTFTALPAFAGSGNEMPATTEATTTTKALVEVDAQIRDLEERLAKAKAKRCLITKCDSTTSRGSSFEKIGKENGKDVLKDTQTETGLTWYPALDERLNHVAANAACLKRGQRLPTKEEFEISEKHGIRQVFLDFSNRVYWSSAVYSNNADYAWAFNGDSGQIDIVYLSKVSSVRCVR